ncbi:MAG: Rpn family recombination-promoting nuclease/putative transposase [Candidatus Brocadiae bacterium]|nr:Rpn family recombination-promoting nuclease/putative transposase [Candidatus Brocadiia bacterium]
MGKKRKRAEKKGWTKNPHDLFFKTAMSDKRNARSFLENYLPQHISALVDMDTLEIEKDSFIGQDLQTYYSDLLYKVHIAGYEGYIYLLFEHKSYEEKWISLQILEYILKIWKLKVKQNEKLPIVIPMVFYHGRQKWETGLSLSDLLECKDERLRPFIPDFQYLFYDFSLSSNTQIQGIEKLQAMIYLFKYIYSPDLEIKLSMIFKLLRNLPDSEIDYIIAISMYLLYTTHIPPDTLSKIAQENISQKGGETIMTTAEQLIAQGEIRGEMKGRIEGEIKGEIKGEMKGRIEGKIEAIESILEFRFRARGLHLMKKIRKINNLDALQKIFSLAKTAPDIESFEKEVQHPTKKA